MRDNLLIALEPEDAKGEDRSVAVTVIAPDPAAIGDWPLVWFAWPGGGYNQHYYDLQLQGRSGYSQAEFHAARGSIFVACDHIGIGDSAIPAGAFNHSDIARTSAAAARKVIAGLADGTLVEALPPLPGLFPVATGQSYGGLLLTHLQAEHGVFRAVAMLGWSGICTQVKDTSGQSKVTGHHHDGFAARIPHAQFCWYARGSLETVAKLGFQCPRKLACLVKASQFATHL